MMMMMMMQLTIVLTLITTVFPAIVDIVAVAEKYHPRTNLRMQLARFVTCGYLSRCIAVWKLMRCVISAIGGQVCYKYPVCSSMLSMSSLEQNSQMAILTSTLIVQLVLSLFWTLNPLHYLQLSVGKQGVLANNCCVLCSRIFLLNLLNMYTFFIALYYKQNDLVSVHFFLSLSSSVYSLSLW